MDSSTIFMFGMMAGVFLVIGIFELTEWLEKRKKK